MNLDLNLQLSLIIVGVVLLVIVYLVTRWSNRRTSSSTEDDDNGRIPDDFDELGPDLQLDGGRTESGAGSHPDTREKSGDVFSSSDPADPVDDNLDANAADEDPAQRGSGGMDGQQDEDREAEIPVLAVEVMPDRPVSGEDRDESDGNADLPGRPNGEAGLHGEGPDDSGDETPAGENDEAGRAGDLPGPDGREGKPGFPDSGNGETPESRGQDGSPEDEPVFPYPDMLDQKYPHTDKLEEDRVEPTLGLGGDDPESQREHRESVVRDPGVFTYPEIEGFARITQIDYWAKIFGGKDVGRENVIAQYRAGASSLSDKCRIFGLKIPDQKWFNVEEQAEGARFNDIVVSIQLAGLDGPVSEWELEKFVRMVERIAMGTGRHYSFMADKKGALQQALAIDGFVRYYESVHLVHVKPVQGNYINGREIERAAGQLGLEKGENHFFIRYKKAGKGKVSLYCLVNMNETGQFDFEDLPALSTEGVIFFFRPTINRLPGAVFAEMMDTAKSFASRVQAEAVWKNNQEVSQHDIDQIRRSIEDAAKEMQALGLASGSEEAMRIFKPY